MHRLLPLLAVLFLSGCTALEDNGTHLAYTLERGAARLRSTADRELVVRYEPLDDPPAAYHVEITPSIHPSGQRPDVWSSYLVVSGRRSGGTSYHNRFVFVPERLFVEKPAAAATEIILRRVGDRIEVAAVR